MLYQDGQGVQQDYAEAMKWFRKAADQGDPEAQYALGVMYKNGRGVPRDDAEAIKWYRKAADQGNADAQNALTTLTAPAPAPSQTATAPALSQPAQHSTSAEGNSDGGMSFFWVWLSIVAGVGGLALYRSNKKHKRAQRLRAIVDERVLTLRKAIEPIEAEFPFMFVSNYSNSGLMSILFMDQQGERLRFVDFGLDNIEPTQDRTIPVSSIVSVELSGGNEVVTDYETTSTKPDALAGALLGGLLFGRAGAIVGATAAGSEATTVATQHVVEKPSALVFELSDLNNPVVRFISMDHAQCDLWLHRVRSAMARQKGHAVAEGGSHSGRLEQPVRPETPGEGLTAAQLRAIRG